MTTPAEVIIQDLRAQAEFHRRCVTDLQETSPEHCEFWTKFANVLDRHADAYIHGQCVNPEVQIAFHAWRIRKHEKTCPAAAR